MAGDSLREDQIRLGLQEFEAITRLLINKGVSAAQLNAKLYDINVDYTLKQLKKLENKA